MRAPFLRNNEKKKNKCCSIELHTSILLLTQQSAKQQLRATNGANRKVNIKLHSRIYQRSCAYISVLHAFSFLFVRAWRQVRSARDPSFCQKKNVFERFERMRLEIKKTWKTKTTAGKQNESGRGKAAGNKERNRRGGKKVTRIGTNSGFHAATSTHRSSPTLSFDSRSSYFVIIARV